MAVGTPLALKRSAPTGARMPFTRLLVPVDGSAPALRAVAVAVELAGALGASVELASVLSLGELDFYDGMYKTPEQVAALHTRHRRAVLEAAQAEVPETVSCSGVLLEGPVAASLLARATETDAHLIVMGRTGKGRLERLLKGSVAQRVSSLAPMPVVLVG